LSTFITDHDFVKDAGWEQASGGVDFPGPQAATLSQGLAENAGLIPFGMPIFSTTAGRYRALPIPLRAFLALFFVFLLTLLAVVLAALLDRRAVDFFATFPAAFLTGFFARVFLLAFATRLEAARFLRGA
jgi:hypothetical protein